jgi:nucleotide-binding universal stress UspA family protein
MFTHILLPVDGSALAERPLAYVERIAPITGAVIHLVEVVQLVPNPAVSYVPPIIPQGAYEEMEQTASAYLAATRERLRAAGVQDVRAVELTGDPAASLLDYEREAGIDLVVLSSHGRTGLARFALGSVAERLVQYGTAPVLLVRAFGAVMVPSHVVIPLDGSAHAEAALPVAARLSPHVVGEATLLRVVTSADDSAAAEQYLAAVAGRIPLGAAQMHQVVVDGDPAQRIIEAADADKLVVMSTRGRGALTRWLLGSVAERVVHAASAPVLLVRE